MLRERCANRPGLVVRIKPTRLMHASGKVRVAKPLWIEPSPDLLGAPFFRHGEGGRKGGC